jgi:DNA-binding NtrC family response regulator
VSAIVRTILVVDKERGTCEAVRFILGDFYDVRLAATRQDLMEAIAEDEIDLVFVDILMPGLGGLSILRDITKRSRAEVVILAAIKDMKMAVNAMRLGAADYLVKPFDANDLRRVVQAIVNPGGDGDDPEDPPPPQSRIPSLEAAEFNLTKRLILDALEKCRWNQTMAARRLRISRRKLKYRMDSIGIMPKKGKGRPRRELSRLGRRIS